jgi:hypothetical protein
MIDVIHLTLTGTHRDGEWLRVRRWGMHFADLRTVDQLAEVVDLATLEEALGGAAAGMVDAWIRFPANTGTGLNSALLIADSQLSGRSRVQTCYIPPRFRCLGCPIHEGLCRPVMADPAHILPYK